MFSCVSRIIKLSFFSYFQSFFEDLVSAVVTILSIISQKLIRICQRCLRTRARREGVVDMQNIEE